MLMREQIIKYKLITLRTSLINLHTSLNKIWSKWNIITYVLRGLAEHLLFVIVAEFRKKNAPFLLYLTA
jgi:hypothetical protein